MTVYAIHYGEKRDEGPFTREEVTDRLNKYRATFPEKTVEQVMANVVVWEMQPHSTTGRDLDPMQFLDE